VFNSTVLFKLLSTLHPQHSLLFNYFLLSLPSVLSQTVGDNTSRHPIQRHPSRFHRSICFVCAATPICRSQVLAHYCAHRFVRPTMHHQAPSCIHLPSQPDRSHVIHRSTPLQSYAYRRCPHRTDCPSSLFPPRLLHPQGAYDRNFDTRAFIRFRHSRRLP